MKLDGFIEAEKQADRGVARCCRLFEVSRAAYYQRQTTTPSVRQASDAQLTERIREIHDVSDGTYGTPRVTAKLRHEGEQVSHRRVGRLDLLLEDQTYSLQQVGDYVMWGPGIGHSWKAETESVVTTIRWPSTTG